MSSIVTAAPSAPADASLRDRLYRKVAWRVMPLLLLCYIANFIDRFPR